MFRIQFTLSKKTDADLISFFTQQNEKTASLVVAALLSYIQGVELAPQLLPVTVTEQVKRVNVSILIRKNNRRQTDIRVLEEFMNSIPAGMKSVFIKGILRHTYGSVIYQTEATVPRKNTLPVYVVPDYVSSPDSCVPEQKPQKADYTDDTGDNDIFGLFESLLD